MSNNIWLNAHAIGSRQTAGLSKTDTVPMRTRSQTDHTQVPACTVTLFSVWIGSGYCRVVSGPATQSAELEELTQRLLKMDM